MLSRTSIFALGLSVAALAFASTPADANDQCYYHHDNFIRHTQGFFPIVVLTCPVYQTGENPLYYRYKRLPGQSVSPQYSLGEIERAGLECGIPTRSVSPDVKTCFLSEASRRAAAQIVGRSPERIGVVQSKDAQDWRTPEFKVFSFSLFDAAALAFGVTHVGRAWNTGRRALSLLPKSRSVQPRYRPYRAQGRSEERRPVMLDGAAFR